MSKDQIRLERLQDLYSMPNATEYEIAQEVKRRSDIEINKAKGK